MNLTSPWFHDLWCTTLDANAEKVWRLWPEQTLDYMVEHNVTLQTEDLWFLQYTIVDHETSELVASEAIRLIGILTEAQRCNPNAAIDILRNVVVHPIIMRRYWGVKALWQAHVPEGLPILRERLTVETEPLVYRAIKGAIAALIANTLE